MRVGVSPQSGGERVAVSFFVGNEKKCPTSKGRGLDGVSVHKEAKGKERGWSYDETIGEQAAKMKQPSLVRAKLDGDIGNEKKMSDRC